MINLFLLSVTISISVSQDNSYLFTHVRILPESTRSVPNGKEGTARVRVAFTRRLSQMEKVVWFFIIQVMISHSSLFLETKSELSFAYPTQPPRYGLKNCY